MSETFNRRRFFNGLLTGGAGALVASLLDNSRTHAFEMYKDLPFIDQYFKGTMKILTGLRDVQTGLIERETKTAYERTKKGGTIYSQITAGHFPTEETALDRQGQPGALAFLERNAKEDVYAKLNPNDMIFTNTINLNNFPAMKRGIRVVGVTVNYYPFAQTPPEEGYQIEYEGKLVKMEDASNVIIDSQMPWYNGLVHPPQLQFKIIPGGGLAQAAVYWMVAAELAGLKAHKGTPDDYGWARYYIDTCIERTLMVGQDRPKFVTVAKHLGDLVEAGAKWYVFGANHALVSDACGVANGPMVTRGYKADQVKKGDIVLIGAYSSNHPEELAVAQESRNKGAYVVAITPFSEDGDASGDRLYKEVDAAFNSYSPESWGVVPGIDKERKVCPTTGVLGDLILWMLMAQWTEEMAHRGEFPYFYKGYFMKNGREHNESVRPYFMKRGW